jgi:cellulose synthase/poly-beta-1,6-N-acetylglucosamine synthase-like glycosyltransferase
VILLWWISGILLALVWLDRLRDARNIRHVADISRPEWDRLPHPAPRVSIIVPARNEAPHVEAALRSVLNLDYPNYEVFVVNDRSTDATGEIIDRIAASHPGAPPLHVLHITDLPPGWLGKPHAMWLSAQQAAGDWLLFTDADVSFRPDCLRRAIAYAERERADHLAASAKKS